METSTRQMNENKNDFICAIQDQTSMTKSSSTVARASVESCVREPVENDDRHNHCSCNTQIKWFLWNIVFAFVWS